MVYRFLKGIDKNQYHPILVTNRSDALFEKVQTLGISTKIIPFPSLLDVYEKEILKYSPIKKILTVFEIIRYNIKIAYLINAEKPDIVWCSNLRALLTISLAVKLFQIPLIWNCWSWEKSEAWFRILNILGLKIANKIVTEYERQKYDIFDYSKIKVNEKKFTTVYTGFDFCRFSHLNQGERSELGLSGKDFVIGKVGVLVPNKGAIFFLKMAQQISSKFDNVKFLIVGDIPDDSYRNYYASLKEIVKKFGIEDKVSFLGWRDDVPKILSCIDLFVSASLREGLPGAVREAMAMGIPVVATDVGGTSEAVQHEQTGLIVPPKDVQALTQAVSYMIENPKLAKEMGLKGRERAERLFSIQVYVKNYERVFDELLQKKNC